MPNPSELAPLPGEPAATAPPALAIRGLSKFFGTFQALRDISLDIHKGEFVCFLGPSGCGKTTLLRAIAGLDLHDQGTIHQNGRDISKAPVAGRDFGIVFQSYALFPNLTVARNVGYGLRGHGMTRQKRKARVEELLALVDLSGQANKYPAQISGGQQQRVALARALAPSPQLLLLDEPLSALDAQVRLHLRDQLRRLQRNLGVTTAMVTHDQDEALSIADRIVVMNRGMIEQVGTPEEVFLKPASQFVAGFLGDMNFLTAVIEDPQTATVNGVKIRLDTPCDMSVGSPARLGIRPPDIEVARAGDDNHAAHLSQGWLDATIETVSFRGDSYIFSSRCEGLGQALSVAIERDRWHELCLHEGAKVVLSLARTKPHVFSRE